MKLTYFLSVTLLVLLVTPCVLGRDTRGRGDGPGRSRGQGRGGNDGRGRSGSGNEKVCGSISTFNAALLPRDSNYAERGEEIPQALLNADADVYCLQEYWFERDVRALIEAVGGTYPYHYSVLHQEIGVLDEVRTPTDGPITACNIAEIGYFQTAIMACAQQFGCDVAFAQALPLGSACLAQYCAEQLRSPAIGADCLSCPILSATSVAGLFDSCFTTNATDESNRLNAPGLVLLSKREITSATYTSFFPGREMTLQRGYIEAEVDGVGRVACTHLSSISSPLYVEYDLNFGNYTTQQGAEIDVLLQEFDPETATVLGDMNTGPSRSGDSDPERNLIGELEENYDRFIIEGFRSPYFNLDGRCTFCSPVEGNKNIDHIFVGSDFEVSSTTRILDDTDPFPLSDHFGARVDFCRDVDDQQNDPPGQNQRPRGRLWSWREFVIYIKRFFYRRS